MQNKLSIVDTELEILQAAIASLQRCEHLVDSLGIFSANEQVEDIASGDLKYLLIAAYKGDIQSNTEVREPAARKAALATALASYSR